jgi:hypothetical protein
MNSLMDNIMKRTTLVLLVHLAAVGTLQATPVAADEAKGKAWDQAAVTALAQELVRVGGDLRDSVRRKPDVPAIGIRRARSQALDDLRVVQNSIQRLARQLEAGDDQLTTYPTFRRIQTLRRDIAQNARRAALMEPTTSKLESARVILEQLEQFYAAEAEAYDDLN